MKNQKVFESYLKEIASKNSNRLANGVLFSKIVTTRKQLDTTKAKQLLGAKAPVKEIQVSKLRWKIADENN